MSPSVCPLVAPPLHQGAQVTLTHCPSVTHLPKSHQEGEGQGSCPCSLCPRPHAGHSVGRWQEGECVRSDCFPPPRPPPPPELPMRSAAPALSTSPSVWLSLCPPLSPSVYRSLFPPPLPLPTSLPRTGPCSDRGPRHLGGRVASGYGALGWAAGRRRRPLDLRGAGLWPAPEGTWDNGGRARRCSWRLAHWTAVNTSGGHPLLHCTKSLTCD